MEDLRRIWDTVSTWVRRHPWLTGIVVLVLIAGAAAPSEDEDEPAPEEPAVAVEAEEPAETPEPVVPPGPPAERPPDRQTPAEAVVIGRELCATLEADGTLDLRYGSEDAATVARRYVQQTYVGPHPDDAYRGCYGVASDLGTDP